MNIKHKIIGYMKEKTIAIIIWIAIYGFAAVGIYNLFNWLI